MISTVIRAPMPSLRLMIPGVMLKLPSVKQIPFVFFCALRVLAEDSRVVAGPATGSGALHEHGGALRHPVHDRLRTFVNEGV